MQVKMKDNLIARYQTSLKGDLHAVWKMLGWSEYVKLKITLKNIEGKEVELVSAKGSVYEKSSNLWLPDGLWDARSD